MSEDEMQEFIKEEVIPLYEQCASSLEEFTYNFVFLNDDKIPELIANGGNMAAGAVCYTYSNGHVNSINLNDGWFDFIEKENLLNNTYGKMGNYGDTIWSIRDGMFECIAEGTYSFEQDEDGHILYDENDNVLHTYYYWNEKEVSEEEYQNNLLQVFNTEKSIGAENMEFYDTVEEAYENLNP